jgi:signal transduction histidine kinase
MCRQPSSARNSAWKPNVSKKATSSGWSKVTTFVPPSLAQADIFQVLEGCASDASMRATGGRQVALELDGNDDPQVVIDTGRVQQAVSNLLSNALTYSPRESTVVLRGSCDPHAFYIEVENRGSSIAPEDTAKIFEPLTRLGRSGRAAAWASVCSSLTASSRLIRGESGWMP